ncbi:flavin reductase family protein [Rathayibacter iranicus]|uniref:Flavin reductase n=2 Tax=Rathayibacter iranicus TaxID=59737 RepID=A0AAD1AF91_9MICO|nr:flavin reductase family protein [Rathayibacter iranicus]AZZ56050.1 flavin reductase [Rathayibacter iranicus]MWV30262.1 flavin reductase [Rathayibacter iranicus NCPPB 2253 = VKM Ac-1602]PPI46404.1 flavin oxidoreductase [Rathayibacter iranicus]PPI59927.1 flavin oxidoreductase [Rathayibacter iranicus]PPI71395.1 flavin oxidoreductase [Rathayibacter iranicus]
MRKSRDQILKSSYSGSDNFPPDRFRQVFRSHAAGVCLVTAESGGRLAALTVTSVSSVSAEPPVFAFSLSALSSAAVHVARADSVVVHMLDERSIDLALLGARSGVDRFANTDGWRRLPTGEPVFCGARTWLRGQVFERIIIGESTIIIAGAVESSLDDDSEHEEEARPLPLVYYDRAWHSVGDHSRINN